MPIAPYLLPDRLPGVPLYVQIRDQIILAIARGDLKPGDRLPTLRDFAMAANVDMGTVNQAYGELQKKGVLSLERGRGTFVTAPRSEPSDNGTRDKALSEFAAHVLEMAGHLGFTAEELVSAIQTKAKDTA